MTAKIPVMSSEVSISLIVEGQILVLLFYRNRSNRGNSSPLIYWSMIP